MHAVNVHITEIPLDQITLCDVQPAGERA